MEVYQGVSKIKFFNIRQLPYPILNMREKTMLEQSQMAHECGELVSHRHLHFFIIFKIKIYQYSMFIYNIPLCHGMVYKDINSSQDSSRSNGNK